MRIKRVLQGTALTALAAAAWMGAATVDASAATIEGMDIDLYTDKQMMSVNGNGSAEVLFAVGTYNKKGTVKVTSWDVYEDGYADIDLSKLNNTKDNYLVVKTEKSKPVYIKVAASIKKQKLKFDAANNTLDITVDTTPSAWEYRTSYGDWATFDPKQENLFSKYQYQGASLYVRAAASGASLTATADSKVSDAAIKNPTDDDKYTVYDGGTLPGKETKLNIAKQANAPAITADYVKRTVKFKKNTQYRVLVEDNEGNYDFVRDDKGIVVKDSPTDAKNITEFLTMSDGSVASSAVIEARTKADKKAASKWGRLEISKPVAMTILAAAGKDAEIGTSSALKVTNEIEIQGGVKGKDNAYSGKITVKNNANFAIVVTGDKAVTVKAGKTGSVAAASGKEVKIAKAGDKANKTWLGEDVVVGKVK